jgi:uncharacterized protein (DUF2147 family)
MRILPNSVAFAALTFTVVSLTAGTFLSISKAQARPELTGIWLNDTRRGAVQLFKCGGSICGKIVWLKQPLGKDNKPVRDKLNPQPTRRDRPICGLGIIWQLRPQPDGSWGEGRIYDPKVGRSYNLAVDILSSRQIRITGYLGARFLGKSFLWQRAPANLQLCRAS